MASDLRITMIGYTGSGKTCFLVGMYNRMAAVGVEGFSLHMPDPEAGRRLERLWETLQAGGKNRWPPPNPDIFDDYRLELEFSYAPVMNIDWVDYRGGTIDELYSAGDLQTLMKYLEQSSCIFLTVSGEYLVEDLTLERAQKNIRVHRMNELMAQLVRKVQPSRERPLPVAILITQYDYLQAAAGNDPALQERLERIIKALFTPLFASRVHVIMRAPSFLTAICPMTLGVGLAGDKDKDNGILKPLGVEHPIFFAAWAALRQEIADARKDKRDSTEIADLEAMQAQLADRLKHVPIYSEGTRLKVPSEAIQP